MACNDEVYKLLVENCSDPATSQKPTSVKPNIHNILFYLFLKKNKNAGYDRKRS